MIRKALSKIEERNINYKRATDLLQLMELGAIPMNPSILEHRTINIKKAYHITDVPGLKKLYKIQKKKNQISVFTKGSYGMVSNKFLTNATVLVTMEGKSVFESARDIASYLSINGYRWIGPDNISTHYIWDNFSIPIKKKIIKKFDLMDSSFGIAVHVQEIIKENNTGDSSLISEFMDFYFKEAKKLMTNKFIDGLIQNMQDNKESYNGEYNEIFLHNFKIIDVQIIGNNLEPDSEAADDLEKFTKRNKIQISKIIDKHEIAGLG